VGVPARLCSHLGEMTGLTIRATVSQLDCSAPSADVFTCPGSLRIARLPPSSPPMRPRTVYRWYPSPPKVNALVTTTASQPPAVADGDFNFLEHQIGV
jgi:hypothetical protein